MAVGFLSVDHDWVITHVNTEGERITGSLREQLLGHNLWERFPAALGTEFEVNYRRAADTRQQVTFDAYYPEPLDSWIEVRVTPGPEGVAFLLPRRLRPPRGAGAVRAGRCAGGLLNRITGELVGTSTPTRPSNGWRDSRCPPSRIGSSSP
jgi:PAS domain-containing protein